MATSGPCVAAAPFDKLAILAGVVVLVMPVELDELCVRLVVATAVELTLRANFDIVAAEEEDVMVMV